MKITAKGQTEYGYAEITVTGEKNVEAIECEDQDLLSIVERAIKNAEGSMANDYHPEADTMLQAYAYLSRLFPEVDCDGELEEMESEPGVVY